MFFLYLNESYKKVPEGILGTSSGVISRVIPKQKTPWLSFGRCFKQDFYRISLEYKTSSNTCCNVTVILVVIKKLINNIGKNVLLDSLGNLFIRIFRFLFGFVLFVVLFEPTLKRCIDSGT